MDPLREDDVRAMRSATPAEKAAQALDAMRAGIAWKRVALRLRHPDDSEDELEGRLDAWLFERE